MARARCARPLLHEPALGVEITGAARSRASELGGGVTLSTRDALARLCATHGVSVPPDFDIERFERTRGIKRRDWCAPTGPGPVALARLAAERALEDASWAAADLDLIIAATSTPVAISKGMGATIAAGLDSNAASLDVRSGGAGGLEAWSLGATRARAGKHVLVVAAEAPSRFANPTDPTNALLFGDGAGALCLGPSSNSSAGLRFARSARHPAPGRAFSVRGSLPPDPGPHLPGTHFVFAAPDNSYVKALDEAWTIEARALRAALEAADARSALAAPYYVHTAQLDSVAETLALDVSLPRELLEDGGSIGCAAPLAVAAASRARRASPQSIAALAVGGGIATCSLLWTSL